MVGRLTAALRTPRVNLAIVMHPDSWLSLWRLTSFRWLFAVLLLWTQATAGTAAEATAQQKKLFSDTQKLYVEAEQHLSAKKFDDSASSLLQATETLNELIGVVTPELYDALQPTMQKLRRVHALLELEGVSVPPLGIRDRPVPGETPAEPTPKPTPKPTPRPRTPTPRPTPKATPAPASMNNGVSFTSVVAPILANRCGQCHVSASRGGFQMLSYAGLMKGAQAGVVVFPGDVIGSRLIETIETGDMPRGGGRVTPQELAALKTWVMEGAKFDGPDPNAPLGAGAGAPMNAPAQPAMVQRATGKETVSFASDVAPLLLENCQGCHIDAMQDRGGLRMDTLAQLLRGGDSGAVVEPGKGATSLLIRKLRGQEGDRMPAGGRPAFSEDSIALITKWIDEGAKLDGASENQPIRVMSQLAWASKATPEQMNEKRSDLAKEHLALANAANAPTSEITTDSFYITGTASPGTLKLVGEQAEQMMSQVQTLVNGPAGAGFFKGKATIFVLPKRYDYSEFAKMVEQRGIPTEWQSHWHFDGLDAYIAMVVTDQDEPAAVTGRLAAPLGALAVAVRGNNVPRWFAEGVGVTFAAKGRGVLDRDARRVLESEIYAATSAMQDAKQFLDGKLSPEQTDRIGAALASTMLDRTRRRQFDMLMRDMASGTPFELGFQKAYGATVSDYINAWSATMKPR